MIYTFAWSYEAEDDEVFFVFRSFPEIITSVPTTQFKSMSDADREAYAHSAIIVALKALIATRQPLPPPNNEGLDAANGFVRLTVVEAVKLELYKIYLANCENPADLAKKIGKSTTIARRLLDLTHASKIEEIEETLSIFNKRLRHSWDLEAAA